MSAQPRIAVIIPCFEEGPLVVEAALSVQEDEPVEIVVADDASRDEPTARALESLRARGVKVIVHEQNSGPFVARMTALAASESRYVFSLDADDLAVPGTLAAMADLLDANPDAAVCFGDYVAFGDVDEFRVVPASLDPFRVAYWNEYPPSALFRRSILEEVGGWGAAGLVETYYEDWNLWMALAARRARGVHLGEGKVTFRKRMHANRRFATDRLNHRAFYADLKRRHSALFADLAEHRRRSNLSPTRKLLFPIIYGGRRRYSFEPRVRRALERLHIWSPRR